MSQPELFIAYFIQAEENRMKYAVDKIQSVFGSVQIQLLLDDDRATPNIPGATVKTTHAAIYQMALWKSHLTCLLEPIAACQTYGVKFDADTLFCRPFKLPPKPGISGTQQRTDAGAASIQGGCQLITADAAKTMLDVLAANPDEVLDKYLTAVSGCEIMMGSFKRGKICGDWLLGALATCAGVSMMDHKEIHSRWCRVPLPVRVATAAVVHPNRTIEFMRAYAADMALEVK